MFKRENNKKKLFFLQMQNPKIYKIKTKEGHVFCLKIGETIQPIVDTNKNKYGFVLNIESIDSKDELEKFISEEIEKNKGKKIENKILHIDRDQGSQHKESKCPFKIHIGAPVDNSAVKRSRLESSPEDTPVIVSNDDENGVLDNFLDQLPTEILNDEIFKYLNKEELLNILTHNMSLFRRFKNAYLKTFFLDVTRFIVYKGSYQNDDPSTQVFNVEFFVKNYIDIGTEEDFVRIFAEEVFNINLINPEYIPDPLVRNYYSEYLEENYMIYPLSVIEKFKSLNSIRIGVKSPTPFFIDLAILDQQFKNGNGGFNKNKLERIYYVEKVDSKPVVVNSNIQPPTFPIYNLYDKDAPVGNLLPENLKVLVLPDYFNFPITEEGYSVEPEENVLKETTLFPSSLEKLVLNPISGYNFSVQSLSDLQNLKELDIYIGDQLMNNLPPKIEKLKLKLGSVNVSRIDFSKYENLTYLDLFSYRYYLVGEILPKKLNTLLLKKFRRIWKIRYKPITRNS